MPTKSKRTKIKQTIFFYFLKKNCKAYEKQKITQTWLFNKSYN